jgi:hypothetical protein
MVWFQNQLGKSYAPIEVVGMLLDLGGFFRCAIHAALIVEQIIEIGLHPNSFNRDMTELILEPTH